MSNCYITTCFAFSLTALEAGLLQEALELQEALNDNCDSDIALANWNDASAEFRNRFPPTDDSDPISGFLSIFSDANFPCFDADFDIAETDDRDKFNIRVFGTQFDPEAVANLLVRIASPGLPITATWAETSDRNRVDEYSGGGFRIEDGRIHWINAADVRNDRNFMPRYVLTTRDPDEGLLFWNTADGFGDMASATTFTEAEAMSFEPVIAVDQPEWMRLPAASYPHA
jgi:hypothetical protein